MSGGCRDDDVWLKRPFIVPDLWAADEKLLSEGTGAAGDVRRTGSGSLSDRYPLWPVMT